MPQTSKRESTAGRAGPAKTPTDTDTEARRRQEAREDAQASRQDRPGTSMPAQRERWENEGGQPAGVISSTDGAEPAQPEKKKSDD